MSAHPSFLPPEPASDSVDPSAGPDAANDDGEDDPDPEQPCRRWVRPHAPPRRKLSEILGQIERDHSRDRISIGDLVQILGARAFGALLLIFALPNVVPAPPGASGILGLPLLYLSMQMMLGKLPWLPPFIASRSMTREDFAALITRVTPMLKRAEKLLVPRLPLLSTQASEKLIGGLCLILATVLVLPIPLGNMLPAFAICLIALGVLERDGVWILAGTATAVAALLIVYGIVYAMIKAAFFVVLNAF